MQLSELIFIIIVFLLIFDFGFERVLSYLNIKQWDKAVPDGVAGIYDAEKYQKAKSYAKANYKMAVINSLSGLILILLVLFCDGIGFLDRFVNDRVGDSPIFSALLFFGIIGVFSFVTSLPFSIYSTFVIEEKFGFNKTTSKTFVLDIIKSSLLAIIIGGLIMALIVKLFLIFEGDFWIYTWAVFALIMVFMTMFYSRLIVPLFNKQTPLEDGELKDAIAKFGNKVGFELDNIFVIDGSKRSTKANAYFTGLGAKKRIVLYDTLINDHSVEELIAILAHEVGHYKHKHTMSSIIISLLQTALMLFVLSLFIAPDGEIANAAAKSVNSIASFQIGILIFGILYSPISELLGILMNWISRKNEYQADAYAKEFSSGSDLSKALIKLSGNNLTNLNPHPLFVFINYSHPPLLFRINRLK